MKPINYCRCESFKISVAYYNILLYHKTKTLLVLQFSILTFETSFFSAHSLSNQYKTGNTKTTGEMAKIAEAKEELKDGTTNTQPDLGNTEMEERNSTSSSTNL